MKSHLNSRAQELIVAYGDDSPCSTHTHTWKGLICSQKHFLPHSILRKTHTHFSDHIICATPLRLLKESEISRKKQVYMQYLWFTADLGSSGLIFVMLKTPCTYRHRYRCAEEVSDDDKGIPMHKQQSVSKTKVMGSIPMGIAMYAKQCKLLWMKLSVKMHKCQRVTLFCLLWRRFWTIVCDPIYARSIQILCNFTTCTHTHTQNNSTETVFSQ